MVTLLHTSDWHLGKPFASIEDSDKRTLVREARLGVLARLAEVVREEGVHYVLVAGDLFDSPSPSRPLVSGAMSAIGRMEVPVVVIPGNHDHGGPGSVWEQGFFEREQRELAPNLRVLLEEEPVDEGDVVFYPAPLLRRQLVGDPTAWIRAPGVLEEAGDAVRVVLAHGSVQGFSSDVDEEGLPAGPPNRVEIDRLPDGSVDYVALGDWHGTRRVTERAWYSGTPEPDRFPKGDDHEQGGALVVRVGRGTDPEVRRVATGRLGWHVHASRLEGEEDVARLAGDLSTLLDGRARADLLRLALEGRLSLEARGELDALLGSMRSRLLRLKLDDGVRLAPSRGEMEAIAEPGSDPLVYKVAARLVAMIEGSHVGHDGDHRPGPDRDPVEAPEIALRELYALAAE